MPLTHHHTRDCIAGNELDEICCSDSSFMDDPERLAVADRFRVQTTRCVVNVFTDTPDDALVLARLATRSRALSAMPDPQKFSL